MSVPIEALLPHRPPMLWIESLIECTDTTVTATALLGHEHFTVDSGTVPECVLVECMAQTVAAALGQRARTRGHSANAGVGAPGMLAAVSNFQIHSLAPVGKPLRIEVREVKRLGPMLMVAGTVSCDGKTIAAGELTLYA
jgi:predicted hotdog family 3-hydroxylacyl-ACP dehydratase